MSNPTAASTHWWPASVPPLQHPQHESALRGWLLDILPPTVREHRVVHRHLAVLLLLADGHLTASLDGARHTYAIARASLAATHAPETISATMQLIDALGRELARQQQFVSELLANALLE